MHEPPDRSVAARADDQQVDRCAVERELLGRISVCGVRLDVAEGGDSFTRVLDEVVDGLVDPGGSTGGNTPNR